MTSLVTVNEKKFDGYPEERGIAMTHRIKTVIVLPGFKLRVQFSEGVTKLYDLKPLFERIPAFQYLRDNPAEFECVSVDVGGRGIVWDDDLDLSCDELWENGVVVETSITGGIR